MIRGAVLLLTSLSLAGCGRAPRLAERELREAWGEPCAAEHGLVCGRLEYACVESSTTPGRYVAVDCGAAATCSFVVCAGAVVWTELPD